MPNWLQQSFQENTVLWLLISSIVGGIVGASVHFIFDFMLPQQVQQRREVLAVKRKYGTPMLLAATELRNRLENMIKHIEEIEREHWLSIDHPSGYYYLSTLYVVGKLFGWLQILRRTIVYLDFATVKETRQFENYLRAIEDSFTSPSLFSSAPSGYPGQSRDKWIYTFWLQAVGELMIMREDDNYRVLDYAAFYKNFKQSSSEDFRKWFSPVEQLFTEVEAGGPRFKRIVAAYAYLNAFINFSDPKHLRTTRRGDHWGLLSTEEASHIQTRIERIAADSQDN